MSKNTAFAAAAAAFALSSVGAVAAGTNIGAAAGTSGQETVQCFGVHSCKGQADCKTAENDCKGQNECKGHGFKLMAEDDCLAAGGTVGK